MKNGWELVEQRRRQIGVIEAAVVRLDDDVRQVDPPELQGWLERMSFFDLDAGDWWGSPSPDKHEYSFCLWTAERIWYLDKDEGFAELRSHPRTPEAWVKERSS